MEEDLVKLDQQVAGLLEEKEKTIREKPTDINQIMPYIKYFLEHMQDLLIDSPDPVARASYFGVLFDSAPTYQELLSGTQKKAECIKLNEAFMLSQNHLAATAERRSNLVGG